MTRSAPAIFLRAAACLALWACSEPAPREPDAGGAPDAGSACDAGGWQARAAMPTGRFACAGATFSAGGRQLLAVVGGWGESGYSTAAEAYDGASDVWTALPALPSARALPGAADVGGRLHVVGGTNAGGTFDAHLVLDPAAGRWVSAAPLPTLRAEFSTAAARVGDRNLLFVIGGYDADARDTALVEVFDASAGGWRAGAPMPTRRSGAAAAVRGTEAGPRIHVLGGVGAGGGALATHEEYDPAQDAWRTLAPMPAGRRWMVAAFLGGRLYVAGGDARSGPGAPALALVESWDPETDAWRAEPPLSAGRWNMAGAVLGGALHVVGGATRPRTQHEAFAPGDCR